MRWLTRTHLHLDRAATPWLIRRFVDPGAEFLFADRLDPSLLDGDVVPFGFPGIELSSHDDRGTCFRKVMERYGLHDPALELMERIIALGVAEAVGGEPPAGLGDQQRSLGVSLDLLGTGLGVALDDGRHLEAAMALYEAVYVYCRIQTLPASVRAGIPERAAERLPYLRRQLADDRR